MPVAAGAEVAAVPAVEEAVTSKAGPIVMLRDGTKNPATKSKTKTPMMEMKTFTLSMIRDLFF